ncbi:sensor domain-containing diguanylate cyclase [Acholeplasma laidlawii]|uniref:Sensor domain-containing diguanylate cyclase n=2 Tax=Acholeplasma laidlawii TaxID=2148 RepID=A0A553IGG7_ACHLA|nr:sensor domain-containing diguanylate cyclase [Acholeplasma laidlawii]ABX81923.1 putative signalling protein [Acholeplasma laidlawii PG-8A]NWH10905.1 sensor domain-containing diguanylate cyclase [Acholeplasma laidlawii]NWH12291.1 sensor domain-containing diguanylate cyclase [Acholeplasma laidlawii]NWH13677.1 sensor domain-containing diguanylate cyclase [Acholeplasma laidlawii]NWH15000.1 sensor domain-containing diguanylate cyclase [Acholeplasma laidlawii]
MNNKLLTYTKQELIDYILTLEKALKQKEDQLSINIKWAGNLGQWKWLYAENKVFFNALKARTIGYEAEEIGQIGFEFFTSKLHPDDYDRVMDNMRQHLTGKTDAYEVEYRIMHREGYYLWYYDRGIVTKRDKDGKPLELEGIVFDITESKKLEEQLIKYAQSDPLTDALNRRMLFKELEHQIYMNTYKNIPFSLLMFDVDKFKQINDTYGHLVGDEVLIETIQLINKSKRESDITFRYGGDEFFLVLPNTRYKDALNLVSRIQDVFKKTPISSVGYVVLSMGVSQYKPGETIDQLINRVDQMMYQSKQK